MKNMSKIHLNVVIAFLLAALTLYTLQWRTGIAPGLHKQFGRGVDIEGLSSPQRLMQYIALSKQREGTENQLAVLWLGNSQLHAIVEYRDGDFLVSHWMKQLWPRQCDTLNPIVVSLPAASPLEHFVLAHYVFNRQKIDILVIAVTLSNFLGDAIRSDLSVLLTDDVKSALSRHDVASAMAIKEDHKESFGYGLFMEQWLSGQLANISTLWRSRPELRRQIILDLYHLRDWVFNVNPNAIIHLIKPRYVKNMQAIKALLESASQRGIPSFIYIAPIRQDYPPLYDLSEYKTFKNEIWEIAHHYSAVYVDLDTKIPDDLWNSKDPDYFHFSGRGHMLLAEEVMAQIRNFDCSLQKERPGSLLARQRSDAPQMARR